MKFFQNKSNVIMVIVIAALVVAKLLRVEEMNLLDSVLNRFRR